MKPPLLAINSIKATLLAFWLLSGGAGAQPFWTVTVFKSPTVTAVQTLEAADALIASNAIYSNGQLELADMVGYSTGEGTGHFAISSPVPGLTGNVDYYVVRATGRFNVQIPGAYTFATNTDDGARVRIDGGDVVIDDGVHAPRDSAYVSITLSAGTHFVEWVWYENWGGDVAESFAAPGVHTGFDSSFKLVGDPALFPIAPPGQLRWPAQNGYAHPLSKTTSTIQSFTSAEFLSPEYEQTPPSGHDLRHVESI